MGSVLERLFVQYEMMLLMLFLSFLIKVYKYFSLHVNEQSFRSFLSTVWKDLLSDVIIVLCILIIDVYIYSMPYAVMLIGIVLSDSILNWFINKQSEVTGIILDRLVDFVLDEITKGRLNKINKDNDEEILDE